jgi:hypothetical protein
VVMAHIASITKVYLWQFGISLTVWSSPSAVFKSVWLRNRKGMCNSALSVIPETGMIQRV